MEAFDRIESEKAQQQEGFKLTNSEYPCVGSTTVLQPPPDVNELEISR